jgi:hypothetical protein
MSTEQKEDYLSEDPDIPSQKVVLISFLSPEKILANKDLFFFQRFLADYEVQWRTARFEEWLAEQFRAVNKKLDDLAGTLEKTDVSGATLLRSNLLRTDLFIEEFHQYVRKNTKDVSQTDIQTAYDDFLFKESSKLEEEFFAKNEFRTTMRGIKVRGVFASEAEASARAKRLQKSDPSFNIYLGSVGKWMAWEPDPNKVADQEYANDELNTLMKKYRENEESRDQYYNEQKRSRVAAGKPSGSSDKPLNITVVHDVPEGTVPEGTVPEGTVPEGTVEGVAPVAVPEGTVEGLTPVAEAKPVGLEGTPFGASKPGAYDAMFDGPADLAIARKQEKKL